MVCSLVKRFHRKRKDPKRMSEISGQTRGSVCLPFLQGEE